MSTDYVAMLLALSAIAGVMRPRAGFGLMAVSLVLARALSGEYQ